jgi:hypothetical protein
MDNSLNEIRKQISNLSVQMTEIENQIRLQIAHDIECSDASFRLMAMRQELVALVRQRDAMGGAESCPTIAERLASNRRPIVIGKRIDRG